MPSLLGVWKLLEARAVDHAGRELPPPFGPQPIGVFIFEGERMIGVVGDARASLPAADPGRFFVAYTGTYSFDGEVLITKADDASRPELIVEQVRRVQFDGPDRIIATPMSGLLGHNGINVVWQRVG